MPTLYKVKLHESPVLDDNNYERFDLQWLLDVTSSSDLNIQPGDVLYLPELLTGAGEFEAMRFVGKAADGKDSTNMLPLLNGGVEYPELPPEIVALHGKGTLRDAYASIFDAMLAKMTGGPETLQDVMGGGDAEINEYWSNPDMTPPNKQQTKDKWIIPLKDCQIETVPVGTS